MYSARRAGTSSNQRGCIIAAVKHVVSGTATSKRGDTLSFGGRALRFGQRPLRRATNLVRRVSGRDRDKANGAPRVAVPRSYFVEYYSLGVDHHTGSNRAAVEQHDPERGCPRERRRNDVAWIVDGATAVRQSCRAAEPCTD